VRDVVVDLEDGRRRIAREPQDGAQPHEQHEQPRARRADRPWQLVELIDVRRVGVQEDGQRHARHGRDLEPGGIRGAEREEDPS
jgi:hypothetical protein